MAAAIRLQVLRGAKRRGRGEQEEEEDRGTDSVGVDGLMLCLHRIQNLPQSKPTLQYAAKASFPQLSLSSASAQPQPLSLTPLAVPERVPPFSLQSRCPLSTAASYLHPSHALDTPHYCVIDGSSHFNCPALRAQHGDTVVTLLCCSERQR